MKLATALSVISLISLGLSGCKSTCKRGTSTINESCTKTQDCASGLRCIRRLNIFRQPVGNPHCVAGGRKGDSCEAVLGLHYEACTKREDCAAGSTCADNICINKAARKEEKRRVIASRCSTRSHDCRQYGKCHVLEDSDGDYFCGAKTSADCKPSWVCRRYKQCDAVKGRCK